VIRRIKNVLRFFLLRGPLLQWWVARRARQWERAYGQELVKSSGEPFKGSAPASFTNAGCLRSILFIADCMWEQSDLVPELARIAEVVVLDLRPKLNAKPGSQSNAEVVTSAIRDFTGLRKGLAPDLILLYARPALLSQEAFELLRQHWSCPLFGMNLDDKFEFFPYGIFSGGVDNYQAWARNFELNLTNCLPATEWYRARGIPCVYCPPGFHLPDGSAGPTSLDFKYEFGFLGSRKPERVWIMEQLNALGVEIELWGSGWPNAKWVKDPTAIFRNTQINLGIGFASPSRTLTTVKARDFECPGAGACYLTTYNWELSNLYELGKEILCYRSVEELVEMYAYYRKRPKACLEIAQAAWRRCRNEHTWEKRFRKIFIEAGFKVSP
jgi:hypothetical protein